MYSTKHLCPECINKSYKSVRKRQSNRKKIKGVNRHIWKRICKWQMIHEMKQTSTSWVIWKMLCISKKNEPMSTKNFYITVHSNSIHNSQKVEITHMSVSWWTDKTWSIQWSIIWQKKEMKPQMDEPWNKSDTKTICWMIPFIWNVENRQIYRVRK